MKQFIKRALGSLVAAMLAQKRDSLISGAAPSGLLEKLINFSLIKKASSKGDHQALRDQLASFWQGDSAAKFFDTYKSRSTERFFNDHYIVIEELSRILGQPQNECSRLIEIGCGDGAVLGHLATNLDTIDSFIGIDINEEIIARNRRACKRCNTFFMAGDANEQLAINSRPGSILFSYGGVLEYFLNTEVVEMFAMMKSNSPALIVLVEPLYDGFDLDTDIRSKAGGFESSFSHNYPFLVENAGFEVVYQKLLTDDQTWLMLIAKG